MAQRTSLLVVEDDVALATALETRLRSEGFSVARASKVGDALWKLRNQKFEAILIDVRLEQGGSGEDVVRQLRSNPKEPNHYTPVIIMSGFLDQELVTRLRTLERTIVLVKPLDSKLLLERLWMALRGTDGSAPPPGAVGAIASPAQGQELGADVSPDFAAFLHLELRFLHDLSSPVTTATFLTEELMDSGTLPAAQLKAALDHISGLLSAHKETVKERLKRD